MEIAKQVPKEEVVKKQLADLVQLQKRVALIPPGTKPHDWRMEQIRGLRRALVRKGVLPEEALLAPVGYYDEIGGVCNL